MKNKKFVATLLLCGIVGFGYGANNRIDAKAAGLMQVSALEASDYTASNVSQQDIELLNKLFDYDYYVENNPDVVEILGNDPEVMFNHFVTCGIFEGRNCTANFDASAYASAYTDLKDVFKNDILAYYRHYIVFGEQENRDITTVEKCANEGITVTSVINENMQITPFEYTYYSDLLNKGYSDYFSMKSAVNATKNAVASNNHHSSSSTSSNSTNEDSSIENNESENSYNITIPEGAGYVWFNDEEGYISGASLSNHEDFENILLQAIDDAKNASVKILHVSFYKEEPTREYYDAKYGAKPSIENFEEWYGNSTQEERDAFDSLQDEWEEKYIDWQRDNSFSMEYVYTIDLSL